MIGALGYLAVKSLFILPFLAIWLWEKRGARLAEAKQRAKVDGNDRT